MQLRSFEDDILHPTDKWDEVVSIADTLVRCKLDTGADVSCMPISLAKHLMKKNENPKLRSVTTRLCSYFGDRYPCKGAVELGVAYRGRSASERFYVLDMEVMPTLSGETAEALGLIARVSGIAKHSVPAHRSRTPEKAIGKMIEDEELIKWMRGYPTAFCGEESINGYECHITLKSKYRAVANTCRSIPVAYQGATKEELERMLRQGIIERVSEPAEFVSHAVLVKKDNGKVRLCLDPTHLNKAIERSPYPM